MTPRLVSSRRGRAPRRRAQHLGSVLAALGLAVAVIAWVPRAGAAPQPAPAGAAGAKTKTPGAASGAGSRDVNLLLITLDTLRPDHLGCYGASGGSTPNLDGLARGGTLFTRVYAPAPLTLPSHATMMTGLVPRHHGVRDNAIFRLGSSPPTLASVLKARGYKTAAAVGAAVLDRRTGIGRGFDTYDDKVRIRSRSEFNFEERAAQSVVEAAQAKLLQLTPPYFLWVHFYDAHHPYVPPPPYDVRFRGRPYDGEIAYIDAQIGRLLDIVTKRGEAPSTLVIVAGDHGESLGEHGEDRHDVFVYDATQRVPFFVNGPGVPAGKRVERTAGLVDLMPTALALLGVTPPPKLDGASLLPLIAVARAAGGTARGAASPSAEPDYEMESFFPAYSYNWSPPLALVSGRWKYVAAPHAELYDLQTDPRETKNLLPDPATKTAMPPETRAAATRLAGALRARYREDEAARAFGAPGCAPDLEPGCRPPTPPAASGAPTARPDDAGDDAEQRERLAALGYVGGSVAPGSAPPPGPHLDAKDGIGFQRDLDRARMLTATGRPAEAIKILDPIVRRDPRNFPVISATATALLNAGEYDRAVEMQRRNVASRPDYELARANLAGALRAKAASLDGASEGAPGTKPSPAAAALREEAAREYAEALKLNPRDSESYMGLANLELERSRSQAAAEVLKRAVSAQAADPEIWVLLGRIKASLGDAEGARSAFNEALGLEARSASAHEGLGRLDFTTGNARSAEAHYARALELAPKADIAKTLGAIRLNALDDRAGALAAFRRALELTPRESPDAAELREMIQDLETAP